MSDLHRFLNFTGIQFVFVIFLFALGITCLGITYQDYVHARTILTTNSKDLNEAILTCVMLIGFASLIYGAMKLRLIFLSSFRASENPINQGPI